MDASEIGAKLAPWIRARSPELVVLFGSTLSRLRGPEPDIDLGILFGRPVNVGRMIAELSEALISDDVDLMVLDTADPIARLACTQGVPVHEKRRGAFDRFASLARRQFMDTAKFRQMRRNLTQEFIRERVSG